VKRAISSPLLNPSPDDPRLADTVSGTRSVAFVVVEKQSEKCCPAADGAMLRATHRPRATAMRERGMCWDMTVGGEGGGRGRWTLRC
jgi:hypothetical protein